MLRRLAAIAALACFATTAGAAVADTHPAAQLEVKEQALGWWLGGSGTVAMIAGAFMIALANGASKSRARDIELSGGTALAGLGAAVLGAGIFTLVAAAPGPCETSGTALSSQLFLAPSSAGLGIGLGTTF